MFWTIVGALIFVFFVVPIVLGLVLEILAKLFEEDELLGCVALVVILTILMIIIFLILYNMSMREVIRAITYLLVLVFIGCASVYCVFLLLSLIRAMGL